MQGGGLIGKVTAVAHQRSDCGHAQLGDAHQRQTAVGFRADYLVGLTIGQHIAMRPDQREFAVCGDALLPQQLADLGQRDIHPCHGAIVGLAGKGGAGFARGKKNT